MTTICSRNRRFDFCYIANNTDISGSIHNLKENDCFVRERNPYTSLIVIFFKKKSLEVRRIIKM